MHLEALPLQYSPVFFIVKSIARRFAYYQTLQLHVFCVFKISAIISFLRSTQFTNIGSPILSTTWPRYWYEHGGLGSSVDKLPY